MAMNKENSVTLTGTYRTEQVTATFEKTVLTFASKDRDGAWKDGDLEMYLKPELVQQAGIVAGDTIKIKGFLVFNFFTKQDGTTMTFPKIIATEVVEVEKAGAGNFQGNQAQPAAAQPTQPAGYAAGVPPVPGSAPTAPGVAPQQGMPPAPGQPAAPMAPAPQPGQY